MKEELRRVWRIIKLVLKKDGMKSKTPIIIIVGKNSVLIMC